MRNKVLLLPTYFPTIESKIVGSQVHEQTELLSEKYDFKVIYCMEGMGWKKFLFSKLLSIFTNKEHYTSCSNILSPGKLHAEGVYFFNSKFFSESYNVKLRTKAYEYVLKKFIRNNWKPDLIHARTAEYAGVHAAHISKKHNIPLLLTENCIFIIDESISLKKIRNYRFAIESANTVAVVSHYLKAFLHSNNFKCNPLIVGNMVDEERFTLKPTIKQNSPFTIFTAGHTGFTKDWETFFKVIKQLVFVEKFTKIKVIIAITHVFNEYSKNYINSLIDNYQVSEFCEVHYEVPRENMVTLYHQSDVFISTSVNETFGIATCEAMFCGIPVISTRNGGIEDFISPENGRLSDIGDYKGITKHVVDLINNRITFSPEKTRNSVTNKFGKQAFSNRLSGLYTQTIELANK